MLGQEIYLQFVHIICLGSKKPRPVGGPFEESADAGVEILSKSEFEVASSLFSRDNGAVACVLSGYPERQVKHFHVMYSYNDLLATPFARLARGHGSQCSTTSKQTAPMLDYWHHINSIRLRIRSHSPIAERAEDDPAHLDNYRRLCPHSRGLSCGVTLRVH
jgi:hypothetical protein